MKLKSLAGLLFILGFISSANAFNYRGRLSIGGSYGVAFPTLPTEFKNNTDNGSIWSGNVKVGLADDTVLMASYGTIKMKETATGEDLVLRPNIMSLRYYAFHNSPINPYLTAGAGISMNRRHLMGGGTQDFNKFAAQGGVGIEFFITPTASIGAEGLYHHFVATNDESPLRVLTAAGTVNFYFGEPESTKIARADANKAKAERDQLKAERDAAAAEAARQQQNATQAQAEANRQSQAAQSAEQVASAAQQQASQADQARAAAEAQTQQLQSQAQSAQAEMDSLKNMIAKKEVAPIQFATGSDKLLVQSSPALDQVGQIASTYPTLKLRVEGHTDSVGDDTSNMKLSQKRADAVKNYLMNKNTNLPPGQIEAVGFGETKPVASNDTSEGRTQNRRVEFIFLVP